MKENVLKKITRFNNEVNTIPMRDWSTEEMNFFFSVLTRMRDEGTSSIVMDKYELAELARYTIEHNKRYHDTIESLTKKLQDMTYFKKTSNSFVMMPL
ncbi:replication initiation protein, partial [Haloferula chungangensis]